MRRKKNIPAGIYLAIVLILMYLPIIVVAVYSFNANTSRLPNRFTGFSLHYYRQLFRDTKGLVESLKTSLLLALMSCSASMVIGTLGAVGMAKRKFKFGNAFETLAIAPIMIPEIIIGVAFLVLFSAAGIKFGMGTLVLGHITFCTPYVYIVVKGRLSGMDESLVAAARDLGASPMRAFLSVTLPLILPGVLSGTMLAFAMSMDDFIISFFLTGSNVNPLPLKIYSSVKTSVSPQVNALCTLMLVIVFAVAALFMFGGKKKNGGKTE